jgi:pimeloyl-ACP methyl ester carboxylesterase
MLHGQPGGGRDWSQVAAVLGARAHAIAIDRPGWDGRSRAAGLQANAEVALQALDARGVDSATIAGHSLGAAIAVWLAVHYPHRVDALVLAAPAANAASIEALDRWIAAPAVGELISAASLGGMGVALRSGPLRRRLAAAAGLGEDYLAQTGRALSTPSARRAFVTEQRWLVRELPALEIDLPRVAVPTTVLIGAHDRIVPARAARLLTSQLRDARLVVLERAGHLLPQLCARPVAEAIAAALPTPPAANTSGARSG